MVYEEYAAFSTRNCWSVFEFVAALINVAFLIRSPIHLRREKYLPCLR